MCEFDSILAVELDKRLCDAARRNVESNRRRSCAIAAVRRACDDEGRLLLVVGNDGRGEGEVASKAAAAASHEGLAADPDSTLWKNLATIASLKPGDKLDTTTNATLLGVDVSGVGQVNRISLSLCLCLCLCLCLSPTPPSLSHSFLHLSTSRSRAPPEETAAS